MIGQTFNKLIKVTEEFSIRILPSFNTAIMIFFTEVTCKFYRGEGEKRKKQQEKNPVTTKGRTLQPLRTATTNQPRQENVPKLLLHNKDKCMISFR